MADPMTPQRLADIRHRVARATPGPWAYELTGDKDNTWNVGVVMGDDEQPLTGEIELEQGEAIEAICEASLDGTPDDAEFIAHARTDVPDLLAEIDRLRALLDDIDEHIIQVRATTFTLKHPLSCRPHLFACPFNEAGRDLDGPPAPLGCYVVTLDEDGGLVIGEAVTDG